MENQHRKIRGYRELSEADIALMNEIKAAGEKLDHLIAQVRTHISGQLVNQLNMPDQSASEMERARIDLAEPQRWLALGKTDLQNGVMKLVRAVAQPTTF